MKNKPRFLKIVEWSEEDQCYVGSIPGWIGKCCHGDNEEKVYHELCQSFLWHNYSIKIENINNKNILLSISY